MKQAEIFPQALPPGLTYRKELRYSITFRTASDKIRASHQLEIRARD